MLNRLDKTEYEDPSTRTIAIELSYTFTLSPEMESVLRLYGTLHSSPQTPSFAN